MKTTSNEHEPARKGNFFQLFLRNLRQQAKDRDIRHLCEQLLSQRGEASQTALASELISACEALDEEKRLEFFQMLSSDFGPQLEPIRKAAEKYTGAPGTATYEALVAAIESPRQKLFQRMNTAPRGTETLVAMRGDIGRRLKEHPELQALDVDLKVLFTHWFNRGFLRLERIGWHTPASVLEKLIRYESVHEINGWPDLRRRLAPDRRCFAFFHPALNDEPVIFIEIALTQGIAGHLGPLLDLNAPVLDSAAADTAIFYSISNCLNGLRGISFGNFLVKQVVMELQAELPNIKLFSTLSPMPRFASSLRDQQNPLGFTRERLARLLADYSSELVKKSGKADLGEALQLLLQNPLLHRDTLARPLQRLALAYFTKARFKGRVIDPVANFHLANGARLEAINLFGNERPYGLTQSCGLMVNYRYVLDEVEDNHERFVREGEVAVAKRLQAQQKTIESLWDEPQPKVRTAAKAEVKTEAKAEVKAAEPLLAARS
jgi:malonyl-CoA decarboxylase